MTFNVKKTSCMIYKKNLSKLKLRLKEKKNPREWLRALDKISIQLLKIMKKKKKNETI